MTPAETKAKLIRRMRAKGLDGTLALIADDAVYFWSNGAAMFGKVAIAEGLRENFLGVDNDTYDVSDLVWVADSVDVAACVFQLAGQARSTGSRPRAVAADASVLRRVDGEWQVVHENLSNGAWRWA